MRFIKLQSVGDDSHWLRITPDGELNGTGGGGRWTEFQVESHGNNVVSFKSMLHIEDPDKHYVGIQDGNAKSGGETTNDDDGKFKVKFRTPDGDIVEPEHRYDPFRDMRPGYIALFQCHNKDGHLRIHEDGHVDGTGGTGKWAQFRVYATREVRFRSVAHPDRFVVMGEDWVPKGGEGDRSFAVFNIKEGGPSPFAFQSREWHNRGHKMTRFYFGFNGEGQSRNGEITGPGPFGAYELGYA